MKDGRTQFGIVFTLISVLLIGLITQNGCKKRTEPPEPAAPTQTKELAPATAEQTMCPVMKGPINKDYFTTYQGKKVYFCCPGCKEKFEKEPQKYLDKLPQFGS